MLRHIKSFTNNHAVRYMKEFNEKRNFKSLKMCKKCYTFYYKIYYCNQDIQIFTPNIAIHILITITEFV